MGQLELFPESADSPQGAVAGMDAGRPASAPGAVPVSGHTPRRTPPAMTMEEVADVDNLRRAFGCVERNDGAPGADRQSIAQVKAHLSEILPALSRQLLAEQYQPGLIRRVWIPKPDGGQRGLGIPNVIDRVVQQAVYQVLVPHYDPTFHNSSHGFRPERSCHTAIAEAQAYVASGYGWVVDLDLEKFFDRVNHDRLLARLAARVADHRLLRLIRLMLKAKVVLPDGVVVQTAEGTPQGGPLSPLLSNVVLDELDQEMARRGYYFVRYADDANIYVRSPRAGQRVMASISRFIERRLRLKVNTTKSTVTKPERAHFLGFRLRRQPTDGSVAVMLSKRSVDRIYEVIRTKTPRTWGQSLDLCIEDLNRYLRGWIGFFRIVTPAAFTTLSDLDAHIRRRLRAIVLRHWRRTRVIIRRLLRRRVPGSLVRRSVLNARRSWWALSHTPAVDRGLPTRFFQSLGLISLVAHWKAAQTPLAPTVTVPNQLALVWE